MDEQRSRWADDNDDARLQPVRRSSGVHEAGMQGAGAETTIDRPSQTDHTALSSHDKAELYVLGDGLLRREAQHCVA